MKITADRIKHLRKERGLTQKQVAEAIGVSASTINKYELLTSKHKVLKIYKLAVFFDVSLEYLFGRIDTYKIPKIKPTDLKSIG